MSERVTYGQLRGMLCGLGFREDRRGNAIGLKHSESGTLFLFRPS
jgi:hypothetical protein